MVFEIPRSYSGAYPRSDNPKSTTLSACVQIVRLVRTSCLQWWRSYQKMSKMKQQLSVRVLHPPRSLYVGPPTHPSERWEFSPSIKEGLTMHVQRIIHGSAL